MEYGTSHFVSLRAARMYFAEYGDDRAEVARKIRDGEIHIGRPACPKDGEIRLNLREGRYVIRTRATTAQGAESMPEKI
jgi:hypothetical protein